ncbi:MAG: WXG100 family type VII secretion target [Lachnospiraceae bacterium]|nr:WXG100 family type VII secretion target [Lachnospiraceae bacterium]
MASSILVTPEKLITTAQEFSQKGTQVNTLTREMLQIVNAMSAAWTGEASMAYSKQFNALDDDMTKMYRMITEHSTDLQDMARAYQDAEKTNIQSANALPKDVIS